MFPPTGLDSVLATNPGIYGGTGYGRGVEVDREGHARDIDDFQDDGFGAKMDSKPDMEYFMRYTERTE